LDFLIYLFFQAPFPFFPRALTTEPLIQYAPFYEKLQKQCAKTNPNSLKKKREELENRDLKQTKTITQKMPVAAHEP